MINDSEKYLILCPVTVYIRFQWFNLAFQCLLPLWPHHPIALIILSKILFSPLNIKDVAQFTCFLLCLHWLFSWITIVFPAMLQIFRKYWSHIILCIICVLNLVIYPYIDEYFWKNWSRIMTLLNVWDKECCIVLCQDNGSSIHKVF